MALSESVRIETSDALAFLRGLPADSVDLVFTSPPYLAARTYGIGADIKCVEKWTAWMVEVVAESVRVCKGLTAVVCEGQTRNYRYLPGPFLLTSDLYRKGFNLRKPCVYKRQGIPGGGGSKSQHEDTDGSADWLRNDWEPVVCVSRPGKLPWADALACGHPPKCGPGGPPTHRQADGRRRSDVILELRQKRGNTGSRKVDGSKEVWDYIPPDLSNPGNVIDCGNASSLGHEMAHRNEAPFPLELAEFFVRSFCPPDGVACDPFSGSGTTAHAAYQHGRRFVGCDIRTSQVDLAYRRLASVTPSMFSDAG